MREEGGQERYIRGAARRETERKRDRERNGLREWDSMCTCAPERGCALIVPVG